MNLHDFDITEEAKKQGRLEGLNEGRIEKAVEDAENFLRENIAPEVIARCTGLTLEKVHELQKNTLVEA